MSMLNFFKKTKPVDVAAAGIRKAPRVIGISGPGSDLIADQICFGLLNSKATIATFRLSSLSESAVKSAFGWSEINDGIDPITGLSSRQASQLFRDAVDQNVWVAHLNTIRSLSEADVFILYDITSQQELDWVKSQAGLTIGTYGDEHLVDVSLDGDEGIEQICKIVEST